MEAVGFNFLKGVCQTVLGRQNLLQTFTKFGLKESESLNRMANGVDKEIEDHC
jgi:hypothetical protein